MMTVKGNSMTAVASPTKQNLLEVGVCEIEEFSS